MNRGDTDVERGWIVTFGLMVASFGAFVIYANLSLMDLSESLDAADEANAQCRSSVADLGKKLRQAVSDRDFAIARADDAERLMREAAARSTDEAFKRLRAQDATDALRIETAKLRESIAALKAAAILSIGTVKAEKPATVRPRARKRPATARPKAKARTEAPHDWFNWAAPVP